MKFWPIPNTTFMTFHNVNGRFFDGVTSFSLGTIDTVYVLKQVNTCVKVKSAGGILSNNGGWLGESERNNSMLVDFK